MGLFIYKRPQHARRTILSLLACDGATSSPIHVFADGPKTKAEVPAVQATRAVARELLGSSAVFAEHERNRGLANSIIAGTTQLCDQYGAAIVVEDDLVLARSFLRFLNLGLDRYRDERRVMQISGHIVDVPSVKQQQEALLLPWTTSWGWATWKRAWSLFDPAATGWRELFGDEAATKRYNLGGRYDYLGMLKRQMNGEIDSWAIRWYYTVFANEGLVLFPPRTLVSNDGLDGSGTHGRFSRHAPEIMPAGAGEWSMPSEVAESPAMAAVSEAVGRASRPDLWRTVRGLIPSVVTACRSRERKG